MTEEQTLKNVSVAPHSMEWGSASKGTKHKIYYEGEDDGKAKIDAARKLDEYKNFVFGGVTQ